MRRHFQRPFSLPPGATEVVLVRHGAVDRPAPDAFVDGHADPLLSDRGRRQAHAVAAGLAGERLHALFTAPLSRARATAAPLAADSGLVPVLVPALREVHLGEWEGARFQERVLAGDPLSVELFERERWDVVPGAESMEAFGARVADGLAEVVRRTGADRCAAAFTHGGVIAEACRQVTGSRAFAFLGAENGSFTRLVRLSDGRWVLRGFNEVAHLVGAGAGRSSRAA